MILARNHEDLVEGLRALSEHGIELTRANGEISAALASSHEAEYLEIEPGSPLVEIATKSYNADGRVVEYSRGVVATERYPLALYSDWTVHGATIEKPKPTQQ